MILSRWLLLVSVFISVVVSAIAVIADTGASRVCGNLQVVYTNYTSGSLEACGCGGRYEGGLSRRFTLVSHLRRENPNTIVVESGGLSDAPANLLSFRFSVNKYAAVI